MVGGTRVGSSLTRDAVSAGGRYRMTGRKSPTAMMSSATAMDAPVAPAGVVEDRNG